MQNQFADNFFLMILLLCNISSIKPDRGELKEDIFMSPTSPSLVAKVLLATVTRPLKGKMIGLPPDSNAVETMAVQTFVTDRYKG